VQDSRRHERPYGPSTTRRTSGRPYYAPVNLGDDADTTGAVCGQFAGAMWGESGIPGEWLEALARRDMIEGALEGLMS